jgi:hypothetical protein
MEDAVLPSMAVIMHQELSLHPEHLNGSARQKLPCLKFKIVGQMPSLIALHSRVVDVDGDIAQEA